jgi:adenylate cyclase
MRRIVLAVGIFLLAILIFVRGLDPLPVRELRETYFDYLQTLSPREYVPLPVRVVDVDEASLEQYGQWPWPRDRFAEMTEKLTNYGAAVIIFDVIFAEPDRMSPSSLVSRFSNLQANLDQQEIEALASLDTDAMFADAIAQSRVVLGIALSKGVTTELRRSKAGFVEIGDQPGLGAPYLRTPTPILPVLTNAAAGIGAVSVNPLDGSTIVRTVPLIWTSDAGYYPSLSLEALRVAFGASTYVLQGAANIPRFLETVNLSDLSIPTLPDGQLWVHYRHESPELYVSAKDVLAEGYDPVLADKLQGNIVFVGTSAAGLLDIRTTALREPVPGVSIHAQMVEQILLQDFLVRNDFVEALEILTFVLLGVIVLGVMAWFGPLASISAGMLTAIVVLGGSWFAFVQLQILFDATFALVGGFLAFSGLAAYQFIVADRDKRMIRKSFSHYVAPGVLDQIESSGHKVELGGINREVSLMFCDIRNFTPLTETVTADQMVSLLNNLFTKLGGKILAQSGTIDKFIGDAIMAFWNAPVLAENHRELAANAAIDMRSALVDFNAEHDHKPVSCAIGVNTGIACVGNIGSLDRFNYSAIGDTVNVASRIETACRQVDYDILITESMRAGLENFATLEAGYLGLKGKSMRIETHILIGRKAVKESEAFQKLEPLHRQLVREFARTGQLDEARLEECRTLALAIEPGLETFYKKLPERAADFAELLNEKENLGETVPIE